MFHGLATFLLPNLFLHFTLKYSQKFISKFTQKYLILVYAPMIISLGLLTTVVEPVDKLVDL